jgi:NAD-dependent SIR2 family protein deacetylase
VRLLYIYRSVHNETLQPNTLVVLGKDQVPSHKRKLRKLPPGYLIPKVVYNEDSVELDNGGLCLDAMEQVAGRAMLLLVIGTSLSNDGPIKLVKSLARKVHHSGGAIVYIGRGSLTPSKWNTSIDLHLDTDIDTWAAEASIYLAKVS